MKIHLDLDCYFVSAERTRYPFLKGKNVVVVKSSDKKIFSTHKKQETFLGYTGAFNSSFEFSNHYDKDNIINAWKEEFIDKSGKLHGIVIAKSYEAKRYGIKTGTPLVEAFRLCPNLLVIPSDHLFYQLLSQKLQQFLATKIPLLEQYSIDEFFGDLGGFVKDNDVQKYIKTLQNEILEKFDLPITIGANRSKWLAKLVTDKIKPYGTKVLKQGEIDAFLHRVPIEDFPGIGQKIAQKLHSYKIRTLSELKSTPNILKGYGKTGEDLYKRVCGIDDEKVQPDMQRKGVGIGRNFTAIQDRDEIQRRVGIMARYLSFSIMKLNVNPTSFSFKIRYENGAKNSFSMTENRLFNEKFLVNLSHESIKKLDVYPHLKIHYISINSSNFIDSNRKKTLSLIDFNEDKKNAHITKKISKIREKYGIDIIKYANE